MAICHGRQQESYQQVVRAVPLIASLVCKLPILRPAGERIWKQKHNNSIHTHIHILCAQSAMAPPTAVSLDGIDFGESTLQSVIKAIDEEVSFQPEEVLADLSILDRSLLDNVDLNTLSLPSAWNYPHQRAYTGTAVGTTTTERADDATVWRERTKALRREYEQRIGNLEEQLRERHCKELAKSQAARLRAEREKWKNVNRILNNYFEEYNVRI